MLFPRLIGRCSGNWEAVDFNLIPCNVRGQSQRGVCLHVHNLHLQKVEQGHLPHFSDREPRSGWMGSFLNTRDDRLSIKPAAELGRFSHCTLQHNLIPDRCICIQISFSPALMMHNSSSLSSLLHPCPRLHSLNLSPFSVLRPAPSLSSVSYVPLFTLPFSSLHCANTHLPSPHTCGTTQLYFTFFAFPSFRGFVYSEIFLAAQMSH